MYIGKVDLCVFLCAWNTQSVCVCVCVCVVCLTVEVVLNHVLSSSGVSGRGRFWGK